MLRRIVATAATAAALMFIIAPSASAVGVLTVAAGDTQILFTIDPATVVQIVLAVLLPLLVGLVTTKVTSGAVKAWLLAGLTLLTSLFAELARAMEAGANYDLGVALLAAIPAFATSVALHYGLWKPSTISGKVQSIGVKSRSV